MGKRYIFVINSGSTSLKFKIFELGPELKQVSRGSVERIGERIKSHAVGLREVLDQLENIKKQIVAVGHRVVHGGDEFVKPTQVTGMVLRKLVKYNRLAPLHNPANLMGIRAARDLLPRVPQVAVFDTAFYQTLPEAAWRYPLPERYYKSYRVRKFGFHGISHRYVAGEAARILGRKLNQVKLISCHLGGGASVTAIDSGKSVETSMGFTPAEGLMMMTRSGDIDPALPAFLMRKESLPPKRMNQILNEESGILAVAGVDDMLRLYQKLDKGVARAKLAFEMYIHRLRKYIGAYYAVLGGLDGLVFTGSVGAGKAIVRRRACQGLPFLKGVKVMSIKTDEELRIAEETRQLLGI